MKTYKVLQILINTIVTCKNSSYLTSGALTGVNVISYNRYRLTVETENGKREVFDEVKDISDVIVGDIIYFEDNGKYVKRVTDEIGILRQKEREDIYMSKIGMKVASTRDIIEQLQAYERLHGIGAITGLATVCNGDRTIEYKFEIANDSDYNRVFHNDDKHFKTTVVEIPSVLDTELFE